MWFSPISLSLYLVGGCLCQVNLLVRDTKSFAGNLDHLRVEALTHLGATVTQQNRPVLVNLEEREKLLSTLLKRQMPY